MRYGPPDAILCPMLKGRYDEGPHRDQAPPQVLVVDDEPANVRLVQAYLKAEGFRVLGAFSGAEALEQVEKGGVDLVLLDIRMPHMDGFEVCRRIRQNAACARMPVVFLTAEFNDADSELQGLEAGADEYLHKPIQRRALVARVRNLIRLADAERDRRMASQLAQSEKLAAIGQSPPAWPTRSTTPWPSSSATSPRSGATWTT